MNRLLDLFRSVSRLSATLSGGRAPVYWRRDLSGRSRRLADACRASGWIEELGQVRLRLCDQPLLGRWLTALTQRSASPPAAPAEPLSRSMPSSPRHSRTERSRQIISPVVSARGPSRPELPKISVKRELVLSPAQELSASAAPLSGVPARAEISLLSRLAGKSGSTAAVSISAPQFGDRSVPIHPAPRAMFGRHWLDAADQRARRLLRRHSFDGPHEPGQASRAEPELRVETPLADQLSILLEGPSAPARLLTRLASRETSLGDRVREAGGSAHSRPRASGWPPPLKPETIAPGPQTPQTSSSGVMAEYRQPLTHPENSNERERDIPHNPHGPGSTYERSTLPESDRRQSFVRGQAGAPQRSAQPANQSAIEQESASPQSSHIAPPVLTTGLPELQPPAAPGVPTMPVAAAAARIGARQSEDGARGEDLSLLAEQINRILNEEARRHGIDV